MCPRTLVQLYRGTIKIFSNWATSLEEGLALTEDKLKEQVAVPELGTMFMLCDNSTLHTHIPDISVLPTKITEWRRPPASFQSCQPEWM